MPNVTIEELIQFLEKNTLSDKFQVAYALANEKNSWCLLNCLISFVESDNVESVEYVYNNQIALVREIFPSGLARRVKGIFESQTFEVEKFSAKETATIQGDIRHYDSGQESYYPGGGEWPYFSIEINFNRRSNSWVSETVASQDLPVFPGRNAAMNYLTGFRHSDWFQLPGILAPLRDFRGRIDSVEIDGPNMRVKIEPRKLKISDFLVKVNAESEKDTVLLERAEPNKSGFFEFQTPAQLSGVAVALLEKNSQMPVDGAEWSPRRSSRKFVVKGGTALESLVTQGEDETVEYKVEIDRDDREEFMETLSSFSNTRGGVIILGVNDRLEVIGFHRKKEDIARMIDDGIDPIPTYRIEEANYGGQNLLLVYVEKGKLQPYISRRTRKAYGRRRGNDYFLSASEIRNLVLDSAQHYSGGLAV